MTTNRPHIAVVGSSNIDLTFRTSRLPRSGETITGLAFHLSYGGKGANQAVMAAKLGARVTFVSKLGHDVFAEGLRRHYQDQGIDTAHVLTDPDRLSGVASIVVDDEARNCIIVVPGANLGLTPRDVQEAAPAIRAARVLVCQLEVPLETTLEAFRVAKAAGVRTILNPAPAVPLAEELLRLTDMCIPNETEIELLTQKPAATFEQAATAAMALRERGPQTVIVTLGVRGLLVADGKTVEHVAAVPVQAVDPTGAGDAFIGSLAVFLAEGDSMSRAVRRANAVAALSVTRLGAQTAFPSHAEAAAFLARHVTRPAPPPPPVPRSP
jgi:ribokinase